MGRFSAMERDLSKRKGGFAVKGSVLAESSGVGGGSSEEEKNG